MNGALVTSSTTPSRASHTPPRRTAGPARLLERVIALGYGAAYDAVVDSFGPYQRLLDDIVRYAVRSLAHIDPPAQVLDVACGTGTVAFRLAREGYTVIGLDRVGHLVQVARERRWNRRVLNVGFHHVDIGFDGLHSWRERFDFAVSMHTLYWHPNPLGVLHATRRALKPGGHAMFLNYGRPARVMSTCRAVWRADGALAALRSLRWLVPTAAFEKLRNYEPHYTDMETFRRLLTETGFEVLESRPTFLGGISQLAWVRRPS